jgi:hypothetical protein
MRQTAVEYLEYMWTLQGAIYLDDIDKAKEMEREQHEYRWVKCKKIIYEGFVYIKYSDLLECEKSFNNCT